MIVNKDLLAVVVWIRLSHSDLSSVCRALMVQSADISVTIGAEVSSVDSLFNMVGVSYTSSA